MSFNKNTWSKDYAGARGIKLLGAEDARRKGFTPKYARKGMRGTADDSRDGKEGRVSARKE